MGNWNDQISGLAINNPSTGTQCRVHVCWNTYCSGNLYGGMTDYISTTPFVGNFANDVFSYVAVIGYQLTDPYVMYYKSCLGTQDYAWFISGTQNIFATNLEQNSIGNDQLSALTVSINAATILYVDDQYEGGSILFTGITVNCLTSWSGWNDVTSSARQYDLTGGAFETPVANWVEIGSGNSISQSITYGYTSQETTTSTTTLTTQITNTVKAGFDIDGISGSDEVSVSVATSFSESLSQCLTQSTTSTWTVSCDGAQCPSGVILLYAFQMSFSRPWNNVPGYNGVTLLATSDTVCICSSYQPPQCVPGHCDDIINSCSVCN
jgi:hypothetical protein